jgi:hypothetical protein
MADLPLPGPRGRTPIPNQHPGGSASPLADSFRSGFWGQAVDAVERETHAWHQADPNFDYVQHIPKGYESFANAFQGASSQEEVDAIKSSIDGNVALRQRRAERSFGKNLWTDLLAGVADPVNLVGLGGAAGAGAVKGALQGAKTLGVAGALEATATSALDPTSTPEEGLTSAATAFGLGTVIGSAAGRWGRAAPRHSVRPVDWSIRDGLIKRGIPETAATAAAIGASAEGGKVGALGPVTRATKGQRARGIGQWLGSRAASAERKYGPGVWADKEKQLDHMADELKGEDPGGKAVLAAGNVKDAAVAYVTKFMRPAKGFETERDLQAVSDALGEPLDNPAAYVDRLEGFDLPDHIDGIPVVEAKGEAEPFAMYVPGKSAEQIRGETALEEARRFKSGEAILGAEVADNPLEGIEHVRFSELGDVVRSETRKANTIPGYAERLGLEGARQRAIQEDEVRAVVEGARKKALMADMQRKQDAGEIQWGKGRGVDAAGESLDRDRLTTRVRILRDRVAALGRQATRGVKADSAALRAELARAEQELSEAGGESTPDILHGELEASGSRLAAEGDAHARARQSDQPDEDLADLRAADREKRIRDLDSGELPDELPFGLSESTAFGDFDGAHFRINASKIVNSFPAKPWTEGRDGITAFADDAFETPAEWLRFVIAHEREHSLNPRLPEEDAAAYENRVNERAYQEVMANRADVGIEGTLAKTALIGTPRHRLYSLVPDVKAKIHTAMYQLASDFSEMTAAGKAGRAVLPDGSVAQRIDMWKAKVAEISSELRHHYLEDIGLGSSNRAVDMLRTAAQRFTGNKSFEQFKQEVIAHHVGFTETWNGHDYAQVTDSVKAAVAVLQKIEAQFEKEASDLDIFGQHRAQRESAAAKLDAVGMTDEAAKLREGADEPMTKQGGQHYHRIYSVTALRENPDDAILRLTQAYKRVGHPDPAKAAAEAYERLTMDPDGMGGLRRTAQGTKQVEIPWLDSEAFPYIERDPEYSYAIYARQMGAQIEMTRTFGDAHALDTIDAMRADLEQRGVPREKAEEALQLFEDARDHLNGQFHRLDALAWDYRTARAIKMFTSLVTLGKTIYSQVADAATFTMVQGLGAKRLITGKGPAGIIGGLAAAFHGDISRFHPGGVAKLSGEALDLSVTRSAARMMDSDAAVLAMKDTAFERLLAKAQVPFFILNLMSPWTVAIKEMGGLVAAHNIIEDARLVADHLHSRGADLRTETKTPGVFFHGSKQTDLKAIRSAKESGGEKGRGNNGIYFTPKEKLAWGYSAGGRTYRVELITKNPKTVPVHEIVHVSDEDLARYRAEGYDSLISENGHEYVVFDQHQIRHLDEDLKTPTTAGVPKNVQQAIERLGRSNIDRQDAQLLATMPYERGAQNLILPNVMAWQGEAGAAMRKKLLAAVNGEIKRSVITPGVLDRPRVFDGVFYSKAGRDAALVEVDARKADVEAAKAGLKGLDPTSAEYQDALESLKAATADYQQARAAVGQQGRNYQPLLSLPFQLHSFALASGSKLLHGLFSAPERNKVGGMLGLVLTGMYVTWLKQTDPIGGITGNAEQKKRRSDNWDKMTWGEFMAHTVEYSNLGGILVDVVKAADVATQELTGGVIPGFGYDPQDPGQARLQHSEEIGAVAGAGPGLISTLVEPFVRGQPTSAKAAAVRRVLPFANLIWWKGAIDRLQDLTKGGGGATPAPADMRSMGAPSHDFLGGTQSVMPDARASDIASVLPPIGAAVPAPTVTIPDVPLDPHHPLPNKPGKGRKKKRAPRRGPFTTLPELT